MIKQPVPNNTICCLCLPFAEFSAVTGLRKNHAFWISNFRRVLNVVCFLLGNSPASVFYMPMFRNTICSIFYLPMKMEQIECSETSAYKIQTPGNYPEESIQESRSLGFALFTTKAKKNITAPRSLEDIWQQKWFHVPCFPSYNCEYLLIIADFRIFHTKLSILYPSSFQS